MGLGLGEKALSFVLERAEASKEINQIHILNYVIGYYDLIADPPDLDSEPPLIHDCYKKFNAAFHGRMVQVFWSLAVIRRRVTSNGFQNTVRDSGLEKWNVYFPDHPAHETGDKDMSHLCKSFPPNLTWVRLCGIMDVTDEGLHVLSQRLEQLKALKFLDLEFLAEKKNRAMSDGMTDAGVYDLAKALLSLDMLKGLELSLNGVEITNDGLVTLAQSIAKLQKLTSVTLDFDMAATFSDRGLNELTDAFLKMTSLQEFCLKIASVKTVALRTKDHCRMEFQARDVKIELH